MDAHIDAITTHLQQQLSAAIQQVFDIAAPPELRLDKPPKPELGDFAVGCFPLAKLLRQAPPKIAAALAEALPTTDIIDNVSVTGPYLNITINKAQFFRMTCSHILNEPDSFGNSTVGMGKRVMVEYSAPNTNKPLHLGHVRNQVLGMAVANILAANGYEVVRANLLNDRGVHICKSMLAYQQSGRNDTPEKSGLKSDHFVGKYYVKFEQSLRAEQDAWFTAQTIDPSSLSEEEKGKKDAQFLKESKNYNAALELLTKWESGDPETVALWKKMNQWAYDGFQQSYDRIGSKFDTLYYESNLYKSGKDLVQQGLEQGVFYQKDDGSVWVDLEAEKLGQKLLLRSNGTSVYITQDIGTAKRKFDDHHQDQSVYVVANEQEYHFNVLFSILKKLGFAWAEGCHHLSYGMVFLPEGKMKSREGKVVDADELMENMVALAKDTMRSNEIEGVTLEMIDDIGETIGMGAIKYYILDFHPSKSISFDPQKSIAFQGNTGPYLQYAYVRIRSVFRKSEEFGFEQITPDVDFSVLTHLKEVELAHQLFRFPYEVQVAGEAYNPSGLTSYLFSLAKLYSQFYHACPILAAETPELVKARLVLCKATALVLKRGLALLDITVPERM